MGWLFEAWASIPMMPVAWFSSTDLQILRDSLIITGLFGDAARFRCRCSCSEFIFTFDRIVIVQ